MSIYNMINGTNPATFFILPVLGRHPDDYPRFRDCFIGDPERDDTEGKIIVFTRTGGGNREGYEAENDEITEMDGFLFDYDDDFDCTFANWVFDIPEKWMTDVDHILEGNHNKVSQEYVQMLVDIYPTLGDKIREAFVRSD